MKNLIPSTIAALCLSACLAVPAWATPAADAPASYDVHIAIDGQPFVPAPSLGAPYITAGGRTMLPLRAVSSALGYRVDYDRGAITVSDAHSGYDAQFTVGSTAYIDDDMPKESDTPPIIRPDGRTYVPLRLLMGPFDVTWNPAHRTVHLSRRHEEPLPVMTQGSLRDIIKKPSDVKIHWRLSRPAALLSKDEKAVLDVIETFNKHYFVAACGNQAPFSDTITRDPVFLRALNERQTSQVAHAVDTETAYRMVLYLETLDIKENAAKVILWRRITEKTSGHPFLPAGETIDVPSAVEEAYMLEKVDDRWYLKNNFCNPDALPHHPRIERIREAKDANTWLTDFAYDPAEDTGYHLMDIE